MERNKGNSRYVSGKASKAESTCLSFAIADISHRLGESQGRETRLPPHWFGSPHLAAASPNWCGTRQLREPPGQKPLRGSRFHPLPRASWGLSWLELAPPKARHLQTGFANNWLTVLSFCDLIQMPECGGQACFPRLPAPEGWGRGWELHESRAQRPGVASRPCRFAAK